MGVAGRLDHERHGELGDLRFFLIRAEEPAGAAGQRNRSLRGRSADGRHAGATRGHGQHLGKRPDRTDPDHAELLSRRHARDAHALPRDHTELHERGRGRRDSRRDGIPGGTAKTDELSTGTTEVGGASVTATTSPART